MSYRKMLDYFDRLEVKVNIHKDGEQLVVDCKHEDFSLSKDILADLGFGEELQETIFANFKTIGAKCDCDVLLLFEEDVLELASNNKLFESITKKEGKDESNQVGEKTEDDNVGK